MNFKLQTSFISLNQKMTLFILKEYILLISKPIGVIFVILNMLSVELENHFEAQKQQSNDERS